MAENYGSDYISILDDDGKEYELEVLSTIEYNGSTYLAVIPADENSVLSGTPEVIIVKSIEEDGEPILCTVDDDTELQAVNDLLLESLFQEAETE